MPVQSAEVVVIGNIGIDTNIYPYGEAIDWSVEANFSENLDTVGQAGGYASRGYAALGRRCAFIGHVGADAHGELIRATLARDAINMSALAIDPRGSSRSVNFMSRDGRRKNFYDAKGHMELQPDLELCRSVLTGARLAHVNLANWARQLLPLARALRLVVACDLQDLVALDDPYRRDFVEGADIVFCSAVNHTAEALVAALVAQHPELLVVVGMGAQGCAVGDRSGTRYFPPVALAQPVVDTNGAGDGLAVGFLTSYVLEGRPVAESVRRGQFVARHTCTLRGTSDGLLTAAQLEAYATPE